MLLTLIDCNSGIKLHSVMIMALLGLVGCEIFMKITVSNVDIIDLRNAVWFKAWCFVAKYTLSFEMCKVNI